MARNMLRFWDRMEDFFLRNATEIVDDMADQRHEQLAELLASLDERTAQVAAAEARAEQLERRLGGLGADRPEQDEIDRLLAELARSRSPTHGKRSRNRRKSSRSSATG